MSRRALLRAGPQSTAFFDETFDCEWANGQVCTVKPEFLLFNVILLTLKTTVSNDMHVRTMSTSLLSLRWVENVQINEIHQALSQSGLTISFNWLVCSKLLHLYHIAPMQSLEDNIYSYYQYNPLDLESYHRMHHIINDHARNMSSIGESLHYHQLEKIVHCHIEY